jgi:hypothetical protein
MKKGALTILEFYIFVKIIDILVALATVFEEKTAKMLAKITKKKKKIEHAFMPRKFIDVEKNP